MFNRRAAIWFIAVLVIATQLAAQARPDFSGIWVLAKDRSSQTQQSQTVTTVAGLLGEQFTAKQDAKTLELVITAVGREIKAIYNLDGSESRNFNPTSPGQPDEPIVSRVSWEGDKLVILTTGTTLLNGKPLESKRVMWIDADGLLIIERSADRSPVLRSVYRRQ